ncbi:MAG: branched-chain amino acid ABC transporter substrate-binding protein [Anaerolineales bacterium]|nr:branched-chain amino acid ABC transporter substrate-binding protein [Anaerolineales bacterium]
MNKRWFALLSLLVFASLILTACGSVKSAEVKGALKIVSSLPMTGDSLTQTQPMANAMQMRIDQTGGTVCNGAYTISYEPWDDASATLGKWDATLEIENANRAVADPSIVAYLGTFNSGAAKLSLPILNQANLAMISPANTYPGLTHAVSGVTEAGEPEKYYPSGIRNYVRIAATDDLQGPVAVNFMVSQGIKSVYILDDQEVYGKGIGDAVNQAAKIAGITVIAQEGFDPKASDYRALMTKISTSNNGGAPEAIFLAAIIGNNAAQVLKDKVSVMGDNNKVKFIGPDGIFTASLISVAGADVAEGVFVTNPGLALKDLGKAGKKFYADYAVKYGDTKEPYAIMSYDAMSAAIKAIEDVCAAGGSPTNRAAVTRAAFAIKQFDGALGIWSFNENGDITLPYFLVAQVQKGAFVDFGTFTP